MIVRNPETSTSEGQSVEATGDARERRRNAIGLAILALVVLIGTVLFTTPAAKFHPYVAFEVPQAQLKVLMVQKGEPTLRECDVIRNRMVDALTRTCAMCKVVQNSCVEGLEAEDRKLLTDGPIAKASARTPAGIVVYESANAQVALAACMQSEQTAALGGQLGLVTCFPPGASRAVAGEGKVSLVDSAHSSARYLLYGAMGLFTAFAAFVALHLLSARSPVEGGGALAYEPPKLSNLLKRFLDIVASLMLLVVLSPFFAVVAILLLLFQGPPLFYVSRRYVTLGNRVSVLKFRTMVRDAQSPKYRLRERFMRDGYLDIPLSCEVYTPLGRLLERWQVVEMLQLFNVVLNGMSLVGNRPLPAENVELLKKFKGWECRFESPAGMTGISQVVGKLNQTPEQRLELECLYSRAYRSRNANILWCDLLIVYHTAKVLLLGKFLPYEKAKEILRRAARSSPALL